MNRRRKMQNFLICIMGFLGHGAEFKLVFLCGLFVFLSDKIRVDLIWPSVTSFLWASFHFFLDTIFEGIFSSKIVEHLLVCKKCDGILFKFSKQKCSFRSENFMFYNLGRKNAPKVLT